MLSFRSTTVLLLWSAVFRAWSGSDRMSFRGGSQSVPRQLWSGYSPCATPATDRSLILAVLIALLTLSVGPGAVHAGSPDCNNNAIPNACDLSCGAPGGPCDVPVCGTSPLKYNATQKTGTRER